MLHRSLRELSLVLLLKHLRRMPNLLLLSMFVKIHWVDSTMKNLRGSFAKNIPLWMAIHFFALNSPNACWKPEHPYRSLWKPFVREGYIEPRSEIPERVSMPNVESIFSEERQAGVGDCGIVLVGDAAVVAEDLPFFRLDHSEQAIDG